MKKSVAILSLALLFVTIAFVNLTCASEYSLSNEETHTSPQGVSPQAMSKDPLVGTVAETMNSGGYTYILLQTKAKMFWVAIAESTVTVGEEVVLASGMEMIEFHSKSLDRTFDSIIFSEGMISQGGEAAPKPQKKTYGSSGAKPSAQKEIKVAKAGGGNAYTVSELFEKRKELDEYFTQIKAGQDEAAKAAEAEAAAEAEEKEAEAGGEEAEVEATEEKKE